MRDGRLIPSVIGALVLAFLVFAALHDIAWGRQESYWVEFAFLAVSLPGAVMLHRLAVRHLSPRQRPLWLLLAGGLVLLFKIAVVRACIQPLHLYDAETGLGFLIAGMPLLAAVVWRAARA